MKKLRVRLKDRSYDILIGPKLFQKSGRLLKRLGLGRDAIIITNRHLFGLYGKSLGAILKRSGFTAAFEIVPDSEKAKSSGEAPAVLNRIAAHDRYRTIFLIALGGGVVGDLTGFIASIYKRGVPYVQIPTTLLAQVDSSIGGKTAIDLPAAKNLAGAFHQPKVVISDVSILKSLPRRQLKSGMAEIIKYGVIKDRKLFSYLETNHRSILKGDERTLEYVISRSSRIKADVVRKDEFDKKGLRVILNYGHTAGHAIEAASAYSGKYDHGQSVAIGMAIAADIALKLKLITQEKVRRITSLIERCGLPVNIRGLSFLKIYEALGHDKKFIRGKNRFVLPLSIGRVKVVENIPEQIIKEVIKRRLCHD